MLFNALHVCVFMFLSSCFLWIGYGHPSSLFGWMGSDNVIAGFMAGIDCARYRKKNANRMVISRLDADIAKVVVKSMD